MDTGSPAVQPGTLSPLNCEDQKNEANATKLGTEQQLGSNNQDAELMKAANYTGSIKFSDTSDRELGPEKVCIKAT